MIPRHPIFQGSLVALPTPFSGERLDLGSMLQLIEHQIGARSQGVVIAGSTGEGATLTRRERLTLFEYCAGVAGGRIAVIAGIGGSATRDAVELAVGAERAGVQGLLVTTPAYNRPSPLGLERHFEAVAKASVLPMALYNIPARTGVDLLPESVGRLAESCPTIVAIKEASNSLERLRDLLALDQLAVLTGDDHLILEALQLGVAGVVGVVANLAPDRVLEILRKHQSAPSEAQAIGNSLRPLIEALHCESNPGPLKHALESLGWMQADLRLPLVPVSRTHAKQIYEALIRAELFEPLG